MKYDQISLTPDTVSRVSQNPPTRHRKSYGRRSNVVESWVTQPHPLAWEAALLAADGDARRLEVIDALHIDIHNDPDWRRR